MMVSANLPGKLYKEGKMTAYWIARAKINDSKEYKKYTDLVYLNACLIMEMLFLTFEKIHVGN